MPENEKPLPTKCLIKCVASAMYDEFEAEGLTVEQVARSIERRIFETSKTIPRALNMIRNDISTHLGPATDKFDREKHTHKFANL